MRKIGKIKSRLEALREKRLQKRGISKRGKAAPLTTTQKKEDATESNRLGRYAAKGILII